MKFADGQERREEDQWSWLGERAVMRSWWKGVTEFEVDMDQIKNEVMLAGTRRRGDGEIFEHEISKAEKPLWDASDKEEWSKVLQSGAVRVLSVEE